jgi:N-acetylmuramoyl-L-alanine amidase
MRAALNAKPMANRTRRDYQRVIAAYRGIYLIAPASAKADPSAAAVAETLLEMGRRFNDDKILQRAIEQYKFLRREYPGSKSRYEALFMIGEIYKDDFADLAQARASFRNFLRQYPHHRLADDARQSLAELDQEADAGPAASRRSVEKKNPGEMAMGKIAKKDVESKVTPRKDEGKDSGEVRASDKNPSSETRRGPPARVTGIRHWSTSEYSRVAIDVENVNLQNGDLQNNDLQNNLEFSSQRTANPPRILLDLQRTTLSPAVGGKPLEINDKFLKRIRFEQDANGHSRVALDVDNFCDYDAFLLPNPPRLIVDIHRKASVPEQRVEAGRSASEAMTSDRPAIKLPTTNGEMHSPIVKRIVEADDDDDSTPSSKTSNAKRGMNPVTGNGRMHNADGSDSPDSNPSANSHSFSLGSSQKSTRMLATEKVGSRSDLGIREASPTASGDRSLVRALGLKIGKIVIDPGHGGHDTGTIGPNGLEEKDLVLEVARRLGKLLETRLGAEVVYTRRDDKFIPLENRTAIANRARADLFLSIHANSSHDPGARGVETYYLNFTSSPEALEVAARENAVSEKSIYELQDLVKKIALKDKIEESREFAWDVQQSLHSGLAGKSPAVRDRGVKKAPFIVLIGANMPSILAEISFVSNPTDEHRLATSEYRQRIAESLYRGIAKYANGLSGVKIASKLDKAAGQ